MSTVLRSKGTIRFAFKDPIKVLNKQPKKNSLIMLHFSYGGMRFKYSTGYYSCFTDWDLQKHRIRSKAHILDGAYVNDFLNTLESELYKEISRLNSQQIVISKELLRFKLDEITSKGTVESVDEEIYFFDYIDKFCLRKKGKIAPVTLRSYRQTKRLLLEHDDKVNFEDINLDFYDDFVTFLEKDNKSVNTIGKHIKNLKSFLNSATQDGVNTNLAYKSTDFKAPKEQTTAIYLDESELRRIAEYSLSAYPNLDRARDIFLIGCYTGQRVSDYNGLKPSNFYKKDSIEFFKIKQRKTGKEVLCPITKEIRMILNKPNNRGLPPLKMNDQDINEYIKQVARKAGINATVINEFTKGGKKIVQEIPKYKLIGTHTARRSFCTNMYKKGMPTYDIMLFSGHSTEREFYKYIRIEKEQKAINLAKSRYFNL